MAYALLAEMRIDLFRKLDALAPAYLLRRRSGDLVALATQDVETVEYFFAHTIAPAFVAVLVPVSVVVALAWIAWPLALVLAAVPVVRRGLAGAGAQADRPARIGGARRTGADRRVCDRDDPGPGRTGRYSARPDGGATASCGGANYQALRLALLADLSFQAARWMLRTGLGGLAVAAVGAVLVTAWQVRSDRCCRCSC